MRYLAPLMVLVLLAVAQLPSSTARGQAPESTPAAPSYAAVEPEVWEDTAGGQTARFLVLLRAQADVRAAGSQAASWADKGRAVYSALRQTAGASQPGITHQLDALAAHYRAYYVVNALAVEGNRDVVEALARRPEVLAIESDRPFPVSLEPQAQASPAAGDGALGQPGDAGSTPAPGQSTPQWNVAQCARAGSLGVRLLRARHGVCQRRYRREVGPSGAQATLSGLGRRRGGPQLQLVGCGPRSDQPERRQRAVWLQQRPAL